MRNRIQSKFMLMIIAVIFLFSGKWIETEAAGERAYFGSEGYEWALDETASIGIYAGADQNLSAAELYVRYDSGVLEYQTGGELIEPGLIKVYGEGISATEYMQMLEFVPRIACNTQITIESGSIVNELGEVVAVTPVTVGVIIPMAEGCALDGIQVNGIPISGFSAGVTDYQMEVDTEVTQAQITVLPVERSVEISDTTLVAGENIIQIITSNAAGNRARYVIRISKPELSAPVSRNQSDKKEEIETQKEAIVLAEKEESGINFRVILIIVIVGLCLLLLVLVYIFVKEKKKQEELRRKRKRRAAKKRKAVAAGKTLPKKVHKKDNDFSGGKCDVRTEAAHSEKTSIEENISDEVVQKEKELEVSVQNVTMEFKREKDESTSIKELMIRTLKRQRSYEMFRALDNVSFDIYKGEVVGIIGTNGSGKSTILKIISGALAPTSGKVEVDRNKIQLLTLGTGFDFELTGRENVYLNGAIIGYTKEYIDENYEEIVKFAELEGFMEEKVRNYSSGMVSRLGFAIATIRNTPEILILDEVLSVGDMFFRQKSEARIKEMMHGGSTVLIVSHSTSVIRNNCTKAVWIEKGIMRAIGDPKEVCAAYEKMNEEAK